MCPNTTETSRQSFQTLATPQIKPVWPELPLREVPLAKLLQQVARPRQEPLLQPVALLQPQALLRPGERPRLEELLVRVVLQEERLLPAGLVQARKLRCPARSCPQLLPPRWSHLWIVW